MPKALTKQEVRQQLLDHIHTLVDYWSVQPASTTHAALNGLAFSILATFDGVSMEMPTIDLVMRPHPSDKQYCIDNGLDWIEDGTVINDDCALHHMWYRK